ncbi:short chain dehydrogenase family protein, partial [Chlamydia psittaci 84-8471/1]
LLLDGGFTSSLN